jgi:16S rRNA (cytosine967-C5)-methyltransferase
MPARSAPGKSAREIALKVLVEYPGVDRPDELLDRLLREHRLERRDRALATQIVSGTVKWRLRLDHIIKHFSRKKRVVSPVILNILRMSIYQLMFLDRVPPYSVTDEAVRIAKAEGDSYQARYVNAILRTYLREKDGIAYPGLSRDPVRHISIMYSHPPWLIKRWLGRYGEEEVMALARANNRVPLTGLRVNALRAEVAEVEAMLSESGAEIMEGGGLVPNHIYIRGAAAIDASPAYRRGLFQVQDAGSTLIGHIVAPGPGQVLADLCSAPGGKATHLYELAGGDAVVLAGDLVVERLIKVRENAARLGHDGIRVFVSDARRPAVAGCDAVLLDAPCTGLGVLARKWDLRWTKREEDVARMAAYQKELLLGAAGAVKSGGVLVYSTCSIEPEENENVVEAALAEGAGLELEDISRYVPGSVVYKYGMMQTLPHVHGVDGLFGARLRKT